MTNEIHARLPAGPWPPPRPEPITDPDIIDGYLEDASRMRGHASALYRPRNEHELAAILYHLDRERTPATIVAERTSTTGSSVPPGGAVVSVEKLGAFVGVSRSTRLARAGAGILLGTFQREVEARGLFYPPDPTSRNECTLGASVACNASGARTFKYGPTRAHVHRLRVVLPGGWLVDVHRGQVRAGERGAFQLVLPGGERRTIPCPSYPVPAVKHAAGYQVGPDRDLLDLFIGSEGTLGVIAEVEVRLLALPDKVLGVFATWPEPGLAVAFVKEARRRRSGGSVEPRCLEWFDEAALHLIAEFAPEHRFPSRARAAVFFEQECTDRDEEGLLEAWYDLLVETGALIDEPDGVIVADTAARRQLLYDLRHAVPAGVNERAARNGMPKVGTDLAVPDDALDAMMAAYDQAAGDVLGFLGPERAAEVLRAVSPVPAGADMAGARTIPASGSSDSGAGVADGRHIERSWDAQGLPRRFETVVFGHIGDNHVHVNFLPADDHALTVARYVYDALTDRAISLGGTVSAEHGIGKLKRRALLRLLGRPAVEQMIAVKRALDPRAILGPGNLFEPEWL